MIEIPLTSEPEQRFTIDINKIVYNVRVLLNNRNGVWYISFFNDSNEPIVTEIALLGGVNILDQYNIDITNLFAIVLEDPKRDATKYDLGTEAFLYMVEDGDDIDIELVNG